MSPRLRHAPMTWHRPENLMTASARIAPASSGMPPSAEALSAANGAPPELPADAAPCWRSVEELLERLCATGATFATTSCPTSRIEMYQPGRRFQLRTDRGASWVAIEDVRTCWETFERLGRINRKDVLDPGRQSALIIGLFGQLPGIRRVTDDGEYLVLPPSNHGATGKRLDPSVPHS